MNLKEIIETTLTKVGSTVILDTTTGEKTTVKPIIEYDEVNNILYIKSNIKPYRLVCIKKYLENYIGKKVNNIIVGRPEC